MIDCKNGRVPPRDWTPRQAAITISQFSSDADYVWEVATLFPVADEIPE
ncbi:MAG: hypothetical protein IT425_03780 [Pirellulales bacterium]|nr:hypothetical protein [Pirellulales bacterium]